MDGLAATRAIRAASPTVQVVALTSSKDEALVQQALKAGVVGYLLKNASIDALASAIRAAHEGRLALSPEATQALVNVATRDESAAFNLTEREQDILLLLVEGLTNRQIAQRLSLSQSTIKFYVSSILAKMNVSSRTEAVALALQHRLVKS
jgi:NarL family two-component system response regulator LiaR